MYRAGILTGPGRVLLTSGLEFQCWFEGGLAEGRVCCGSGAVRGERELDRDCGLPAPLTGGFIGVYRRGALSGPVWQSTLGGGWLHGPTGPTGRLEGEAVFLYPDLRTALAGRWEGGVLLGGRPTSVTAVHWPGWLPRLEVAPPAPAAPLHCYCPADPGAVRVPAQLRDPYESKTVVVGCSTATGGGDGLLARRDLAAGTVAAFYHGLLLPPGQPSPNSSSAYMIFMDWAGHGLYPDCHSMDIPEQFWPAEAYCASLAHKTNHSFRPNCEFGRFQHPVFGLACLALRTLVPVQAGTELFVHYRYTASYAPQWFLDLTEVVGSTEHTE